MRAQHAPSTLARHARCSAVLALPFCRAASSTRCAIRASSLDFITWCREPQPPGGVGSGPTAVLRLPLGPEPIHAACMPRACHHVHAIHICACYTHAVHMAHVTEAPRLSKAREVRHRRRRARRCARRCARRRTEGYVPRIVHGAAVTRQRAELGRHRGELWVRACKGRAAVARVPVPLRRPVQCGVSSTTVCVHCAHAPRTHRARTTAHAPHVCCGYTCSSSTAAGLYSRQFSRHSLSHIGLQPLTYRVAGLYSR